jgi:hypothetical protein
MNNIKDWKTFNENLNYLEFSSQEEFISFWKEKWSGKEAERFPKEFIDAFPTKDDYSEFEKDEYDYQDEDDEFDFDPGDEVNNISQEFMINIGDQPEDDISEEDWVDFFNSCWTWL